MRFVTPVANWLPNKAPHPTVYSYGFLLVPRTKPALPAAGKLGRWAEDH